MSVASRTGTWDWLQTNYDRDIEAGSNLQDSTLGVEGSKVAALRFRLIINVVCVWSHARLIPISSSRRSGHSASTPQILSAPLTRPEEAQVEAERPGELIAPGLVFAHAMTREPRTVAPHHDISARQRTGARLSDRYARALKLRIDGTRGSACLQSDGRRSEGVFSRD